ncbi:MAG: MerR family transcriptional regulator [Clostridiales bacterium]|nr:MerR family transcriptional regulator [Clostridiales bacterium]
MKMKKACEATALTERAIRLYLAKNLITPNQINGTLDFSPGDIRQLKDIALLRHFDFSIEQIARMISQPGSIMQIIRHRMEHARTEAEHSSLVSSTLSQINAASVNSLHTLADQIRAQSTGSFMPNFGRFDEISTEERRNQKSAVLAQLDAAAKKTRRIKRISIAACIAVILVAAAALYLVHPRVQGFIPFKPFTIIALNADSITVSIEDEKIREIIPLDHITVPYRAHGVPLSAGETIDSGAQLAINISNFDLLRIGVNPLQPLHTGSEAVNREWMRFLIHTLFEHSYQDEAKLWIREYNPAQYRQLFLWEE